VRSLLLANLALLLAAPAASAATTVDIEVAPAETRLGSTTRVTGTVAIDGAPAAGRRVELQGSRYPYDDELAPLDETTTRADGTYAFTRKLDRNWQLRVVAAGRISKRVRAYVFPATRLTFHARSSRVIRLTQRYTVPRGVRLGQPTRFYVGRRGVATAPRVATAELRRTRPGRYLSTAIVRIPAAWNGRFRYASCFRYTVGSGMGDPKARCPRRFRF
jgi:hypothetical protein